MTQPVRASKKWAKPPGRMDSLNTRHIFASDNVFGFPVIGNAGGLCPPKMWPYHVRTRSQEIQNNSSVHFFLDDYQFEVTWFLPKRALSRVKRFRYALTPDFSIWSHWPETLQRFNVYRNRWVGAFWMSHGCDVIPCVSWAGAESFDFCFAGILPGSTVAISSVGVKDKTKYICNVSTMIDIVKPSNILCYGRMPASVDVEILEYPTWWER